MSDVQFVATEFYRNGGYVPYSDWFNLARLSGYEVIPISEMDASDSSKSYIITPFNGEWVQGWPGAKARIIHYELEYREQKEQPPGVTEVWAGDKWYCDKLGMRYVPIGSHEGLDEFTGCTFDSTPPNYDVALMCYRAPYRREKIINEMLSLGLSIAPNAWEFSRSYNLLCSKCMVAIHQWDNYPCIAPLRMCIAAAHHLPVISEWVNDSGLFKGLFIPYSYEGLSQLVKAAVNAPDPKLPEYGEKLYQKLCVDYTFRHSIEAAL